MCVCHAFSRLSLAVIAWKKELISLMRCVVCVQELMDLFNAGNEMRHVGATKMNAESSRSHSIFRCARAHVLAVMSS